MIRINNWFRTKLQMGPVFINEIILNLERILVIPGILGTLEMLLETSDKGAIVNLEDIPKNENISWENWLKSYPGSGLYF